MPIVIPVNLQDVQAFSDLPIGEYLGEIDSIKYLEPRQAGKFPQLQVQYLVIDGDQVGRKQSEWLSLSDKAAFRLKRWFAKFGYGDMADLEVDEDSEMLTNPDLVGVQVVFKVQGRKDDPTRTEVVLMTVEDDMSAPVAAPAPAVARRPTPPAPAPATEEPLPFADEATDEEAVEEAAPAPAPRRAAPAAPPARTAPAPRAPAAATPARRTLR